MSTGPYDLLKVTEELARWHDACDAVGVPHNPDALIRHHRGNAALAAAVEARHVLATAKVTYGVTLTDAPLEFPLPLTAKTYAEAVEQFRSFTTPDIRLVVQRTLDWEDVTPDDN